MSAFPQSAFHTLAWRPGLSGLLLLAALLLAQPAGAVSLADAQSLYDAGNYRAAALAGQSLGTAEGLTVAVRARLVRAAYLLPEDRAKAELYEAQDLAHQALAKNPDDTEAMLDLAIILGYRARVEGYVGAYFDGLAKQARRLIRRVMELDPGSAWAQAVDAGWNTEIVLGAGPGLAKTLFGATRDEALMHYQDAVKLDPDNPTIRLEYAKALIKLRGQEGWADAGQELVQALAKPAKDKYADLVQTQARDLKGALEGGDAHTLAQRLAQIEPFSKP